MKIGRRINVWFMHNGFLYSCKYQRAEDKDLHLDFLKMHFNNRNKRFYFRMVLLSFSIGFTFYYGSYPVTITTPIS